MPHRFLLLAGEEGGGPVVPLAYAARHRTCARRAPPLQPATGRTRLAGAPKRVKALALTLHVYTAGWSFKPRRCVRYQPLLLMGGVTGMHCHPLHLSIAHRQQIASRYSDHEATTKVAYMVETDPLLYEKSG